jgi:2-oxoglutarate ferredoxin oxidoreductase subunit delta
MMNRGGTILVFVERCKGCGLCIPVCKPRVLAISHETNSMGYNYPVLVDAAGCSGCTACAVVCPDVAIEVSREGKTERHPPREQGG